MDNESFWRAIKKIIANGFSPEDIDKLEFYGELFCNGRIIFKRFSPQEQYGCTEGGTTHVIATILAGAETPADCIPKEGSSFKRELKLASIQTQVIENWAKAAGVWIDNIDQFLTNRFGEFIAEGGEAKVYDNGHSLIKSIGLDYYLFPVHAFDRISLHNTLFPETKLTVIGYGRDNYNNLSFASIDLER